MPTTKLEAILSGEVLPINFEKMVNKVAPRQTKISVRKPADLLLNSHSKPIAPPIKIDKTSFTIISLSIVIH